MKNITTSFLDTYHTIQCAFAPELEWLRAESGRICAGCCFILLICFLAAFLKCNSEHERVVKLANELSMVIALHADSNVRVHSSIERNNQ